MNYKVQIDDQVRNATEAEIARLEAIEADNASTQAQHEAQLAAKSSVRAKLKALGLTDTEIAALVG